MQNHGWQNAQRAGAAAMARKARRFPRRKIVGVFADPDMPKLMDLLECGHTNLPPDNRGAGEAKWTICEKCPRKVKEKQP